MRLRLPVPVRLPPALQRVAVTAAVALLSTALAFPLHPLDYDVGEGLDPSWPVGLGMALRRGLAWGRDVVFPFGPAGFLSSPTMAFPALGAVAVALRLVLLAATAAYLFTRLRMPFGAIAAVPLTLLTTWAGIGALARGGELALAPLALLLAVMVDRLLFGEELGVPFAAAGALVSALAMLWKFDVGLEALALLCVGCVCSGLFEEEWRDWGATFQALCTALFAHAVFVVVFWVALHQPLGTFALWVRTSLQLFRGFNDNMVADYASSSQALWAALLLVLVLVIAAVVLRGEVRGRVLAVMVLLASATVLFAKQGFVRHDDGHGVRPFCVGVLLAAVLVSAEHGERVLRGARGSRPAASSLVARGAFVLVLLLSTVSAADAMGFDRPSYLHPIGSLRATARALRFVRSPSARAGRVEWGRDPRSLATTLAIPATMRERIRGRSVHVEPWNTTAVWVHPEWQWRPLPVFQTYSAYTSALDERDAQRLRGDGAPQFVLFERRSIDGRLSRWESPEAMVELVCRYRAALHDERWTLFERLDETQCGAVSQVSHRSVLQGQPVVLQHDDAVIETVRFAGLDAVAGSPVRRWLLRPRPVHLWTGLDRPKARLLTGTQGGRHVVSLPSCLRDRLGGFDTDPFGPLVVFTGAAPPATAHGPAFEVTVERIAFTPATGVC